MKAMRRKKKEEVRINLATFSDGGTWRDLELTQEEFEAVLADFKLEDRPAAAFQAPSGAGAGIYLGTGERMREYFVIMRHQGGERNMIIAQDLHHLLALLEGLLLEGAGASLPLEQAPGFLH